MKVYKYKCSDCGSTRFDKVENGFKCKYCGNIQDVILEEEEKKAEPEKETKVSVQTESQEPETQKVVEKTINPNFKQALINFIICLLGGWFGLHKFIKGEIFWGIIYACTGGVFGVFYIIDCVCSFFDMLGSIKVGDR